MKDDLTMMADVEPAFPPPELASELSGARILLRTEGRKVQALAWALLGFLLLTHFGIPLPISAAGLTLQSGPGVTEVALVALGVIWIWSVSRAVSILYLTELVRHVVKLDKRADAVRNVREMTHLPDQPPPLAPLQMHPHLVWSLGTNVIQAIKVLLLFTVLGSALFFSIWWRWELYRHTWEEPSIDQFWARLAVLAALTLDIGGLTYFIVHFLPLPLTDYSVGSAYNAVFPSNPRIAGALVEDNRTPSRLAAHFLARFRPPQG